MSGDELRRAQNLRAGDRASADAAALHDAIYRLWSFDRGARDEIFRILDRQPVAPINATKAAYANPPLSYGNLEDDIRLVGQSGRLTQVDLQRVLALLDGRQAESDAIALHEAMAGLGTDENTIYRVLTGRSRDEIDAISAAYNQRYGSGGDQLRLDLEDDLSGAELDRAIGLLEGDQVKADVARLRIAMDRLGTDEDGVWDTLQGKTSDYRAMLAQLYYQLYHVELKDDIADDFSDNPISGDELSKTYARLYRGGLSPPAEQIWYAVRGWGTDEAAIRQALANRTAEEIAQIDQEYQGLSEGETLRDGLAGDLSGRDWFDAQQALQGRASTIDQELQRLNELYAYHRTGADNAFAWAFRRGFNTHGPDLDRRVAAANDFYRQATADGRVMTAEERQQLEQLIQFAREDVTTYRQGLDAAGQAVGTLAATAGATLAGVAVIWLSGGTATPLVLVAIRATGGAVGQVIGNILLSGRSYDVEMLPTNFAEGFVNGAALSISFGRAPNATTPIGRALQGALQGAVDGVPAGFVGGIVGTMLQDGVWSDGCGRVW